MKRKQTQSWLGLYAFLTRLLSVFNAFWTRSMVPFKTKLKPVLMNKKHVFKTSFSYFIAFSYILHSAADLKKTKNSFLFCLLISNPIRIFKKIKHFYLKSAILYSKYPNLMLLKILRNFQNRMKILKNEIFIFKILTIL